MAKTSKTTVNLRIVGISIEAEGDGAGAIAAAALDAVLSPLRLLTATQFEVGQVVYLPGSGKRRFWVSQIDGEKVGLTVREPTEGRRLLVRWYKASEVLQQPTD